MSLDEIPKQKITAVMIIEVMGRPKEHIIETINGMVEQIGAEPNVKVTEKTVHEAVEVEKQKDLFTTYAEVEVEVEDPLMLPALMFKYMPSHIDVIEPENLKINNRVYSDILSEIVRRLHRYDEIARVLQVEKNILEKQIRKLTEEKKKE